MILTTEEFELHNNLNKVKDLIRYIDDNMLRRNYATYLRGEAARLELVELGLYLLWELKRFDISD